MKIMGISGSQDASEVLLGHALNACASITDGVSEIVRINDYNILPCKACGMCMKGMGCSQYDKKNDEFSNLVERLLTADAFIFSESCGEMQCCSSVFSHFWERSRLLFEKEHSSEWGFDVDQVERNPFQYKVIATLVTFEESGGASLAVDISEHVQYGFRFTNEITLGVYLPRVEDGKQYIKQYDIEAAEALGIRLGEVIKSELCMIQIEIINGKQII